MENRGCVVKRTVGSGSRVPRDIKSQLGQHGERAS